VLARFGFTDRVNLRRALLFLLLVIPGLVRAQEGPITAEELARAPSPARVAFLVQQASNLGWAGAVPMLRQSAISAYEANSGYASSWYYLYRWAALLGTPQSKALPQWIQAIRNARVGHPNMAEKYEPQPGTLAAYWSPALQHFALGSLAFSEEFFVTLQPVDNPMAVLSILQQLYAADPARFADYQNLAIAIAVVYDTPPPPGWPHGQVPAGVLPRRLPAPEQAFTYWSNLDRTSVSLQRLRRLPAGELKFIVDDAAPFPELDWARRNVTPGLVDFAKAYDMIKYRKDRSGQGQYMWGLADYQLPTILQQGGICVDQAYFASTAGKAKGIPTLMFRGAGLDGRHAWFGYLDGQQHWQLDCGRYAERKFVVGLAFDPQSWGDINDYELLFLADRFRALPTYKLSVLHAQFAAEYVQDGKFPQALKAAREAVNRERRNLGAWNILLKAQEASAPNDLRAEEGVLREAVLAFQKYPDLEVAFARQLVTMLRARGETSAASFEEQRLAKKYQTNRVDLSIKQAADTMERSMTADDLPTQVRTYQQVLDNYGRGAGIDFYDQVVQPFAAHLLTIQQPGPAISAVERAGKYLRVDKGSQLEKEMTEFIARLKAGKN
jgi:hypothetical protein